MPKVVEAEAVGWEVRAWRRLTGRNGCPRWRSLLQRGQAQPALGGWHVAYIREAHHELWTAHQPMSALPANSTRTESLLCACCRQTELSQTFWKQTLVYQFKPDDKVLSIRGAIHQRFRREKVIYEQTVIN